MRLRLWFALVFLISLPAGVSAQARTIWHDTLTIVTDDSILVLAGENSSLKVISATAIPDVAFREKVQATVVNLIENPGALAQTGLHEVSHATTFKLFGVPSSINFHNSIPWVTPTPYQDWSAYTKPDAQLYAERIAPHAWKEVAVNLAPYVVGDLLVRDRLMEHFLRGQALPLFYQVQRPSVPRLLLSPYVGVAIVNGMMQPLNNTQGEIGDIAKAAKRMRINKWVLGGVLQSLYVYSAYRIMSSTLDCGHCSSFQ